jgi:hypothetical protein
MKTSHLRKAVRDGIEAIDGSMSFRGLSTMDPAAFDESVKQTAAYGIMHGVVMNAAPVIGAEVQRIHTWDRRGCIRLASQVDTVIRDVTTDALTLDILNAAPVKAALAVLESYGNALKEGV